ncbi:MAG: hypothetical protein K0Q52_1344 [Microbacterium sp.]|jgi:hypothetical protein|nr:hypothetical protein [Microbacterium sp.]
MSDVLKSELLRSISGLAMLGVSSFVILIPALMLTMGPPLDGVRELDDGMATRMVFGLIASIGITAMYLGSYSVSREFYYRSMPRTIVIGSLRRVFLAKLLSSMTTSIGLCVVGVALWAGVTSLALAAYGRHLRLDGAFWGIVAGSIFVAAAGAVIGASLGWIFRNYYVVSAVVLLLPTMIELPLLFTVPAVERFFPVGAFAGVTGAPIEGLLSVGASCAVLLGWAAAVTALAVVVVQRRER